MELTLIEPATLKLSHNGITEIIKDYDFGVMLWDYTRDESQRIRNEHYIPNKGAFPVLPDTSAILTNRLLDSVDEHPEALRLVGILLPEIFKNQDSRPFMRCTWKDCLSRATEVQKAADESVFANLCCTHGSMLDKMVKSGDSRKVVSAWILCQGGADKAAARMRATSPFHKD